MSNWEHFTDEYFSYSTSTATESDFGELDLFEVDLKKDMFIFKKGDSFDLVSLDLLYCKISFYKDYDDDDPQGITFKFTMDFSSTVPID